MLNESRRTTSLFREYLEGIKDLTVMRKLILSLFLVVVSQNAFAEKHELGLTLGGLLSQDRGRSPNLIHLGGGTALQANYGYRLINGPAALYGEVHFLANPLRTVASGDPASIRDVATIYVTPGIRVKFTRVKAASPYVAVGAGYGVYERSALQIDGTPLHPRYIHRGAFNFGGGVDTKLWRWLGLRGEIRDFYTGSPSYNVPTIHGGQHNVVAGGGFLVKWGE
jgi:hypothetical protein